MELDETLWYQTLGFFNNPFSIKPAAFHEELVGPQKIIKNISNKIASGNVCFVLGAYGAGKTTMMKKIINRFRGEKKVIYYSCNRREGSINFDELLYGRSWYSRVFRIKPKDMILLLDEVQELNRKEQLDVVDYYKDGYFQSVALVTKGKREVRLTNELKKLVGKNVFKLSNIKAKDVVDLVRRRIGPLPLLSDAMIKKIHKMNPNPRAILENCEDVCRHAVESGTDKVTAKHLKLIK
ncbi:MAG: AAA family ATPase [Nanoarchaeota archaeon]|nr:AAA family ATPase [DPANN group archaeon]MBL7116831.1 AAA family ATPase [Nanoarchaeota archaeon]